MSKKYTVLEYGLSVFMSQIQRRITAVTLFPTLVPDLLEEVNLPDNLTKQVRDYDGLSTLSCISPFLLDVLLS